MKKTFIILLVSLFSFNGQAQSIEKETRLVHFNLKKNLGLDGYDPVSYFENEKPLKGKKEFAASFKGVIYYFATIENKKKFLNGALKYEPQYGGWCAYAMGKNGKKVSINPETYKIINEKLYLFYNKFGTNTLDDWNKDESNLKSKAEIFWLTMLE